jgi:hypothetical protein
MLWNGIQFISPDKKYADAYKKKYNLYPCGKGALCKLLRYWIFVFEGCKVSALHFGIYVKNWNNVCVKVYIDA